jgi:hypothetical protein
MNLRRGFFRLWLVLSILYVVVVGAMFFSDVNGEFAKARNPFYAADMLSLPVLCKNARGKDGVDYQLDGPWNDYRQGKEKLCWYDEPKFRSLWPEYKDLTTSYLINVLYTRADMEAPKPVAPWALLLWVIGVALIPPSVILAIGSALGWAFVGFKQAAPRG